jgi:ribonuclease III
MPKSNSSSESTAVSAHDELPYNNANVLVSPTEIHSFLSSYGIIKTTSDFCLYQNAFVHKSYCTRKNENAITGNMLCPEGVIPLQECSNERLEFLGDSVLNISVASYLYERFPSENEGFLTRMRTKLVNGKMLARLCKYVGLEKHILLSRQIEESEGRFNSNILEDAFEAFLGAIYLDLGFQAACDWIMQVIEMHIDFTDLIVLNNNYKDQFFKLFQQIHGYIPKFYEMNVETNPKNGSKTFVVCIKDNGGCVLSIGKGGNKKEAENEASKKALEKISLV